MIKKDNYIWSIILIICLILPHILAGCTHKSGRKENNKKITIQENYQNPIIYDCNCDSLELVILSLKQQIPTNNSKPQIWDGSEIELPKGTVVRLDCQDASNTFGKRDASNNYVTIQQSDGTRTIVRDIDVDTYLNLRISDIIK
jgi:hypothetical protein